jgi:uncharacterized protein
LILLDDLQHVAIRELPTAIAIKLKVQPRASRNAITGVTGDSLKISLTSPPVDGEANQACIAFLADALGVSKSRISIMNGLKGRNKVVVISGLNKAAFLTTIASFSTK